MSEIVDSEVVNLFAVQAGAYGPSVVATNNKLELTWAGVKLTVKPAEDFGAGPTLEYELSNA